MNLENDDGVLGHTRNAVTAMGQNAFCSDESQGLITVKMLGTRLYVLFRIFWFRFNFLDGGEGDGGERSHWSETIS